MLLITLKRAFLSQLPTIKWACTQPLRGLLLTAHCQCILSGSRPFTFPVRPIGPRISFPPGNPNEGSSVGLKHIGDDICLFSERVVYHIQSSACAHFLGIQLTRVSRHPRT
ncbi:hypothetical protein BS17DRAFT_586353 [Gyrodon lividus]|nr:hypothetical protein BS17DRAFT_586353 [Gyrodon lividus]